MGLSAYDSFDREDSALLGTSSSGHTWANASTSTIGVSNEQAAHSGALAPSLGVYMGAGSSGNITALDAFETALGTDVAYAVDYVSPFAPDDSTINPTNIPNWGAWKAAGTGRKLVIGLNLVPAGGTLAEGNAGDYDAEYLALADLLVDEGLEDTIIRLGYEANNPYIGPWEGTVDPDAYIELYQRAHGVFSGAAGANFSFDWNVAIGPAGAITEFADFFPGTDYVDICGLTVFDRWFGAATPPSNDERWEFLETSNMGINDFLTFASEVEKPISFPEWSLFPTTVPEWNGGGDNPGFIENMVRVFNENNPVYQAYPVASHDTAPDVFNVMTYGALGDDAADDAPAIQAALDACAGTKGIVYFPSGYTFLCTTPKSSTVLLEVGDDTNIVATGATIKRGITRMFLCNWSNSATSTAGYSGASNIRVDGGTWDANVAITTANNTFNFSHMSNLVIRNATFKDTVRVHAIDMGGIDYADIYNCTFEGQFFETATDTVMYREVVQIDHCATGNGHNDPADNTICQNVRIWRCTTTTSNTPAPTGFVGSVPGGFAGQHSLASSPGQHTGIVIKDNLVEDFRYAAIRIMGMDGVLIDNNTIRRTGVADPVGLAYNAGVAVDLYGAEPGSDNVEITNNKFGGAGIVPFIDGTDLAAITVNTNNVAE